MTRFSTPLLLLTCAVLVACHVPADADAQVYTPHSTIFRYLFNTNTDGNDCTEGTTGATSSSYSSTGSLFGKLTVPHEGDNPVSCSGLDGIRFNGGSVDFRDEDGAVDGMGNVDGGANAVKPDVVAWANTQNAILRNVIVGNDTAPLDKTVWGMGFRLVWTQQGEMPFDVEVTKGSQFVNLFDFGAFGAAVTVFGEENYDKGVHLVGKVRLHFKLPLGNSFYFYSTTPSLFKTLPGAINTMSFRVRAASPDGEPGSVIDHQMIVSINGEEYRVSDQYGGRFQADETTLLSQPPTELTIGRPQASRYRRNESALRGYIHEIGLYTLQDVDFTENGTLCSFCQYADGLALAPTPPRLIDGQILRLPLRAKNVKVPVVYDRTIRHDGKNSLSYFDFNIDYWKQTNSTTPINGVATLSLQATATPPHLNVDVEDVDGEDDTPFDVAMLVFNSVVTNLNLGEVELIANRSDNCTKTNAVGVVTDDARAEPRSGSFGVCFYDDRFVINVEGTEQTRGDEPKVATVTITKDEDFEAAAYQIVVDVAGNFAGRAFGFLNGNVCIFDSTIVTSDGFVVIKLASEGVKDLTKVDLCVDVYAFTGFETSAVQDATTQIQVSVIRLDNVNDVVKLVELNTAIDNINNVALNKDISAFQSVDVSLVANVVTCQSQDCGDQTIDENTDFPEDVPANTSFRLSVTADLQYFNSRKSSPKHQFTLTVPDASEGMLYLVNETATEESVEISLADRSNNRIPSRPNSEDLVNFSRTALKTGDVIVAFASESTEAESDGTIVTRVLEWVPANNYFNALDVAGDGILGFEFVTKLAVGGCTDVNGCPTQIKYSYKYVNAADEAPIVAILDTVDVFVVGKPSVFSDDIIELSVVNTKDTPVGLGEDGRYFVSDLQILINSPDDDSSMLTVYLGSDTLFSGEVLLFLPSNDDELTTAIDQGLVTFPLCKEIVSSGCNLVGITSYPSMINRVLDSMTVTVKSTRVVAIGLRLDGGLTKSVYVQISEYEETQAPTIEPIGTTDGTATEAPTFNGTATEAPTFNGTGTDTGPEDEDFDENEDEISTIEIVMYVGGAVGYMIAVAAVVVVVRTRRQMRNRQDDLLPRAMSSSPSAMGSSSSLNPKFGAEQLE